MPRASIDENREQAMCDALAKFAITRAPTGHFTCSLCGVVGYDEPVMLHQKDCPLAIPQIDIRRLSAEQRPN